MSPTAVQPELVRRARRLRRDMTNGENRLWQELRTFRRHYGVHVRRQTPIGPYIVDFAVHSAKLVIEVDGHFHEESARKKNDGIRDNRLKQLGYDVLHFRTGDLEEAFDGCVEMILRKLEIMR